MLFLFPGEEAELVASRFKKSDCRVLSAVGRTITVDCPRSLLQAVASGIDEVEWIEPEPQISSAWFQDDALRSRLTLSTGDSADLTGFESGTRLLGFDEAEKRGFQGADEAVAFADTGLDRGDLKNIHTDFSGRVGQPSIFGLFSKSWEDPDGHGTHVARLMATAPDKTGAELADALPGETETERLEAILDGKAKKVGVSVDEAAEEMKREVPMRRFAKPEEIANAIAFLESPAASYINGINLPVDGGRTGSL